MRTMDYSLAFLTAPELDPISAIQVAHQAGYQKVGLRLIPATAAEQDYPLLHSRPLAISVKQALADTGMTIGDIELIWLKPETRISDYAPLLEQASYLGAENIIVIADDPVTSRLEDHLSGLCAMTTPYGIHLNLEAIPWTALNNLKAAMDIVNAINNPNCHLLIDSLHFYRMHSSLETLKHIHPEKIGIMQVCDAPHSLNQQQYQNPRDEAKHGRLFPGDGELALAPLAQQLTQIKTVSIEVPNVHYWSQYPAMQRAKIALEKTKKVFQDVYTA